MLPEAGQLVNIHAHRRAAFNEEWVLQSLRSTQLNAPLPETPCSIGIHPWNAGSVNLEDDLETIEKALDHPQVLALGEAGLDKFADAPVENQQKIFEAQLNLATKWQLPVIIHSVKTNQELIAIRKKFPSGIPLIIHGFNGGSQLASSLVNAGFCLSLGEQLLHSEKLQHTLIQLGIDPVFFETDESELPIASIYKYAAELLKTDVDKLATHMVNKTNRLFQKADESANTK